MKAAFDCSAAEPQQANELNRCKMLVLVAYDWKTLHFCKIVRNDDVIPLTKIRKQHTNELWSMLVIFGRFGLF